MTTNIFEGYDEYCDDCWEYLECGDDRLLLNHWLWTVNYRKAANVLYRRSNQPSISRVIQLWYERALEVDGMELNSVARSIRRYTLGESWGILVDATHHARASVKPGIPGFLARSHWRESALLISRANVLWDNAVKRYY